MAANDSCVTASGTVHISVSMVKDILFDRYSQLVTGVEPSLQ